MNYKKLLIFVLSLFLLQNIIFGALQDSTIHYFNLGNYTGDIGMADMNAYNSPTFVAGVNGNGVQVSGSGSSSAGGNQIYSDNVDKTQIEYNDNYCLSFWANYGTKKSGGYTMWSLGDSGNNAFPAEYTGTATANNIWYVDTYLNTNTAEYLGTNNANFQHYLFCQDYSNSRVYAWENNVLKINESKTFSVDTDDKFLNLGATTLHTYGSDGTHIYDELAIFNKVLDSTERTDLYNGGAGCFYGDVCYSGALTPQITLNITNNSYYNSTPINVSLNTTTNVNMSIYINSVLNQTFTDTNYTTALIELVEGVNNLSFKSEDINGISWNNISVTLDTIKPNISIIGSIVQDFEVNFSTVFNVTDLNLDTCFMDITYLENVTNASQYDKYINCSDTTVFGAAGLYNAILTATDLAGNVETLNLNGTVQPFVYINFKDVYGNNITNYSATIYHGDYIQEIVTNTNNPINVSPFYNGSLSLGNYTFIFDKLGYQLQNFTIAINETSGGLEYNFTVGFSKINVNVYDRDTLALLTQNVDFELLNNGGTPYGATFNTSTGNTTFINNSFINGDYILTATSQDYNAVSYYFSYSGQENATINLYMVIGNKTDDTGEPVIVDVKIVVQDAAGFNVGEGYILKILQQYASEGGDTFIVDSGKTNVQGEVLLNLEYNSIFYSILIEKDGETLKRIDTFKITKFGTNCALGECYYFSLAETIDAGDNYANADNTDFNLRYVNLTNSSGYVQFTFNNLDNLVGEYCLDIYQKISYAYNKIDTSCLNASSGVISTIINGTNEESFKGVAYLNGAAGVLGTIYVDDVGIGTMWGIYGLVGTIILFFVAVGIGGYAASKNVQDAPAITLALAVGVMWATDSLQMVKWGYVILFTVTLIVGVIVWLLYRRK